MMLPDDLNGGEALVDEAPAPENLRSVIEQAVEQQKSDAPDSETPREPKARADRAAHEPPQQGERQRDPATGRFVEGDKPREPLSRETGQPPPQQAQQPGKDQPRPQDGAGLRPPDSYPPRVKAQWTRLPMEVREAIAARENVVSLAEHRAQALAGVEQYAQQAQQSGTTLERALEAYTGIEALLRRDPAAGVIEVLRNTRMAPATILQEVVRRLAPQAFGGGAPGPQGGNFRMEGGGSPISPEVQQFMHETRAWRAEQAQQQEMAVRGHVERQLHDFWTDPRHPYAENVASSMAGLIAQAHARGEPTPPLEQVYETACWMSPEVRTLLIEESRQTGQGRQRQIADQARAAAKATTGAPANGTEYRGAPPANASLRDQIQWAIDAQR